MKEHFTEKKVSLLFDFACMNYLQEFYVNSLFNL